MNAQLVAQCNIVQLDNALHEGNSLIADTGDKAILKSDASFMRLGIVNHVPFIVIG